MQAAASKEEDKAQKARGELLAKDIATIPKGGFIYSNLSSADRGMLDELIALSCQFDALGAQFDERAKQLQDVLQNLFDSQKREHYAP